MMRTHMGRATTIVSFRQRQNKSGTSHHGHNLIILSYVHIYPRNIRRLKLDPKLQRLNLYAFIILSCRDVNLKIKRLTCTL
jgi:hypothetical protein